MVCFLWEINPKFYCLILADGFEADDDEFSESIDNVQLKLISTAKFKCIIIYEDQMITIPTTEDTLSETVLKEAMEKLFIPMNEMESLKLYLMDDTDIDMDTSMEEILEYLPKETKDIPLQLKKL